MRLKGLTQIRFKVKVIPIDIIDNVRLLETTPSCVENKFVDKRVVDDESKGEKENNVDEFIVKGEFYWSYISVEDMRSKYC